MLEADESSFQFLNVYFGSYTSSLHWNSKVRNVWGQKNTFLHCGDVLGPLDVSSRLCNPAGCPCSCYRSHNNPRAAQSNTWLPIRLTPKGVGFFSLLSSHNPPQYPLLCNQLLRTWFLPLQQLVQLSKLMSCQQAKVPLHASARCCSATSRQSAKTVFCSLVI